MTRGEVYERLTKVFREIFDDEKIIIEDSTTAEDIEDWDSFEQINLIVAVEEEFSFKMPLEKVVTMKNVGEMVETIMDMGK